MALMDLDTAANLATTVAVIVGIAFGLAALRRGARERRDHAAVDNVRTVQTQEVRRAMGRVLDLPDDCDPELIRSDPALLEAALAVDSACEMWGSMVFEGIVDLHLLDRMVGGWIRGSWLRLRRWVEAERVLKRNPNVGEWWHWISERLQEDPDPGKAQAAYVAYRGRTAR
jgi:cbb3-type cytochrome oxidase subunit 3